LYNEQFMPRTVDISKLRADLFTLFDEVVQREGDLVVVERRGSPERAVLTSERYFLALELELETLRKAFVALRQASPAARFRLFESGRLHVDADEVLAKSRARQAERITEKRAKLR
jgi:PHD/YefM family antitoxin component YafN of YafNO toxin-antitoxin module